MAYTVAAYLSFCSLEQLRLYFSSTGWDGCRSHGIPPTPPPSSPIPRLGFRHISRLICRYTTLSHTVIELLCSIIKCGLPVVIPKANLSKNS